MDQTVIRALVLIFGQRSLRLFPHTLHQQTITIRSVTQPKRSPNRCLTDQTFSIPGQSLKAVRQGPAIRELVHKGHLPSQVLKQAGPGGTFEGERQSGFAQPGTGQPGQEACHARRGTFQRHQKIATARLGRDWHLHTRPGQHRHPVEFRAQGRGRVIAGPVQAQRLHTGGGLNPEHRVLTVHHQFWHPGNLWPMIGGLCRQGIDLDHNALSTSSSASITMSASMTPKDIGGRIFNTL